MNTLGKTIFNSHAISTSGIEEAKRKLVSAPYNAADYKIDNSLGFEDATIIDKVTNLKPIYWGKIDTASSKMRIKVKLTETNVLFQGVHYYFALDCLQLLAAGSGS